MKNVTYNILTGGRVRFGDRRGHILEVLKEIHTQKFDGEACPIDTLALQEANDFDSENRSFMEQIQNELGFDYVQVSDTVPWETDGLRYNAVIYSRWPLLEVHDFYPRLSVAGLCAAIETEQFGQIGLLSQHLYSYGAYPESEDKRLQELDIVLPHMKKYEQQIISGDFNSTSRSDNYDETYNRRFDVMTRFEEEGYVDALKHLKLPDYQTLQQLRTYNPLRTNGAFRRPIRVDYILLKGLAGRLKGAGIHRSEAARIASDHFPGYIITE